MKRFIRDTYRKQVLIVTMDSRGIRERVLLIIIILLPLPPRGGLGGMKYKPTNYYLLGIPGYTLRITITTYSRYLYPFTDGMTFHISVRL